MELISHSHFSIPGFQTRLKEKTSTSNGLFVCLVQLGTSVTTYTFQIVLPFPSFSQHPKSSHTQSLTPIIVNFKPSVREKFQQQLWVPNYEQHQLNNIWVTKISTKKSQGIPEPFILQTKRDGEAEIGRRRVGGVSLREEEVGSFEKAALMGRREAEGMGMSLIVHGLCASSCWNCPIFACEEAIECLLCHWRLLTLEHTLGPWVTMKKYGLELGDLGLKDFLTNMDINFMGRWVGSYWATSYTWHYLELDLAFLKWPLLIVRSRLAAFGEITSHVYKQFKGCLRVFLKIAKNISKSLINFWKWLRERFIVTLGSISNTYNIWKFSFFKY